MTNQLVLEQDPRGYTEQEKRQTKANLWARLAVNSLGYWETDNKERLNSLAEWMYNLAHDKEK